VSGTAQPRAARRDVVWLDDRLVPAARATLSVYDRGFLYGDAVFETVRAYGGQLFLWQRHARRLAASLRAFAIAVPDADLADAARAVLAARGLADGAVRVTVSRGKRRRPGARSHAAATLVVTAREIPAELPELRAQGVRVLLLPFGRGHGAVTDGHKTNAYLPAVIGKTRAAAQGAFEGLYVERDGTISEGTTSNLFAVRGDRLLTPALDAGCLPGVTRQTVLALARKAGLVCETATLAAARLHEQDEVFLTASTIEVMPVVRIGRRRVGDGRPGPRTRLLQERYRALVARMLAR